MTKFPISRTNEGYLNDRPMNPPPEPSPEPVRGVNIFLTVVILSVLIMIVFVFCYCCHKGNKKPSPSLSAMIWRDPDVPLQIYTVEAAENRLVEMEDCTERDVPQCPTPTAPPPYETVIKCDEEVAIKSDTSGPPSYEAALRSLDKSLPSHWTQYV